MRIWDVSWELSCNSEAGFYANSDSNLETFMRVNTTEILHLILRHFVNYIYNNFYVFNANSNPMELEIYPPFSDTCYAQQKPNVR